MNRTTTYRRAIASTTALSLLYLVAVFGLTVLVEGLKGFVGAFSLVTIAYAVVGRGLAPQDGPR